MVKNNNNKDHLCPKCKFECIETKVAYICPNCDYLHIKKYEWVGDTTKCPKCGSNSKVYKNHGAGKTFVCDKCGVSGRFIDDKELKAKVVDRTTELGKKLAWLFDFPPKIFHHEDDMFADEDEHCKDKKCPHCDVRKIIESHEEEVADFCENHKIEVYVTDDFIEIIHM